ncbi:MAG: LptA/OstA family protein [Pseudomonadota bacterium]
MTSLSLFRVWFLAIGFALSASFAFAQGATPFASFQQNPDQPVDVTADSLTFDREAGTVVFSGDVQLIQGDLTMTANQIEVFYTESGREASDGVTRLVAEGDVSLKSEEETIEAERAVYDLAAGTLDATGNVRLLQGRNALTAEAASIDIEGGTGSFTGRVRSTFVPETE